MESYLIPHYGQGKEDCDKGERRTGPEGKIWGWRRSGGWKKREMAKWIERKKKRWREVCSNNNGNPYWLSVSSSSPLCAVISTQQDEKRLSTKLSQWGVKNSLCTLSGGRRGNTPPLCLSPWPRCCSSSPLYQGALADTDLQQVHRVQMWPLHTTL